MGVMGARGKPASIVLLRVATIHEDSALLTFALTCGVRPTHFRTFQRLLVLRTCLESWDSDIGLPPLRFLRLERGVLLSRCRSNL